MHEREPLSRGVAVGGGNAVLIFLVMSGFIMTIGYAAKAKDQPKSGGGQVGTCGCIGTGCCSGAPLTRHVSDSVSCAPHLPHTPPVSGKFTNFQKEFWARRFSRIAPVYYLSYLVAIPAASIYTAVIICRCSRHGAPPPLLRECERCRPLHSPHSFPLLQDHLRRIVALVAALDGGAADVSTALGGTGGGRRSAAFILAPRHARRDSYTPPTDRAHRPGAEATHCEAD